MLKCKRCSGTNFTSSEGFFFCTDCGLQTHDQQEYDFEEFTETQEKTFSQITIKKQKPSKQNAAVLTTWEEHNYILLGLVNELMSLGAKPSLKLTALQIWTAYLRKYEVAFFSEDPLELPSLGPLYRSKDARVIYNRKLVRLPRKRALEPDLVLCRYEPKAKRRAKRNLAAAEYEAFKDGDPDRTQDHLDLPEPEENKALPVKFSEPAKKVFDRLVKNNRMLNSPVEKPPVGEVLLRTGVVNGRYNHAQYGTISRRILYTILYLALNQCQDDIQLSDVLRYIREGHMSFLKASHFLPEHLATGDEVNRMFNRSEQGSLVGVEIRRNAAMIFKALEMTKMPVPDLKRLVRRYLEELCLPSQLFEIIEQLLVLFPPDLQYSDQPGKGNITPNYEGRACAYILFAMKLLFGLDDQREQSMSATAAGVNEAIGGERPLFVWSEWVEFIEMRKCVLARCHYPSNAIYAGSANNSQQLYLKFCSDLTDKHNTETAVTTNETKNKNMHHLIDQLWQNHEAEQTAAPSLSFEASLTPTRSYFDEIFRSRSVPIPAAAQVNHATRRIDYLLDPKSFCTQCRRQGFNIKVEPAVNNKNVEFTPMLTRSYARVPKDTLFYRYKTDICEDDWLKELHERDRKLEEEKKHVCNTIRKNNEQRRKLDATHQMSEMTQNFYRRKIMELHGLIDDVKENTAAPSSHPTDQKSVGKSKNGKKLKLITSNFDYWLHLVHWSDHIYYTEFKFFENKLPLNFRWLLTHCATMLEMETKELYMELTIVETHFCYVYQPKDKIGNSLNSELINRIRNAMGLW